jgi:hypothetical protein
MRYLPTLPSATLLIAALLLAAPVSARSDEQSASPQAAETDADGVTTGSIGGTQAEKRKKQFDDCMAIWDPGTHMTKRQWRRTCTNTLDELPNL